MAGGQLHICLWKDSTFTELLAWKIPQSILLFGMAQIKNRTHSAHCGKQTTQHIHTEHSCARGNSDPKIAGSAPNSLPSIYLHAPHSTCLKGLIHVCDDYDWNEAMLIKHSYNIYDMFMSRFHCVCEALKRTFDKWEGEVKYIAYYNNYIIWKQQPYNHIYYCSPAHRRTVVLSLRIPAWWLVAKSFFFVCIIIAWDTWVVYSLLKIACNICSHYKSQNIALRMHRVPSEPSLLHKNRIAMALLVHLTGVMKPYTLCLRWGFIISICVETHVNCRDELYVRPIRQTANHLGCLRHIQKATEHP